MTDRGCAEPQSSTFRDGAEWRCAATQQGGWLVEAGFESQSTHEKKRWRHGDRVERVGRLGDRDATTVVAKLA
jgi:hypothetical protein